MGSVALWRCENMKMHLRREDDNNQVSSSLVALPIRIRTSPSLKMEEKAPIDRSSLSAAQRVTPSAQPPTHAAAGAEEERRDKEREVAKSRMLLSLSPFELLYRTKLKSADRMNWNKDKSQTLTQLEVKVDLRVAHFFFCGRRGLVNCDASSRSESPIKPLLFHGCARPDCLK
jgi:hypothetical protein